MVLSYWLSLTRLPLPFLYRSISCFFLLTLVVLTWKTNQNNKNEICRGIQPTGNIVLFSAFAAVLPDSSRHTSVTPSQHGFVQYDVCSSSCTFGIHTAHTHTHTHIAFFFIPPVSLSYLLLSFWKVLSLQLVRLVFLFLQRCAPTVLQCCFKVGGKVVFLDVTNQNASVILFLIFDCRTRRITPPLDHWQLLKSFQKPLNCRLLYLLTLFFFSSELLLCFFRLP